MKPGDHPEFFRRPAPEGRSRESGIRLDREGRFWHQGGAVAHEGMAAAFASWVARHPEDGRFVLTNGYDWSYLEVEDVPFFVHSLRIEGERVWLALSDGTTEPLDASSLSVGQGDAVYVRVKAGQFEARFRPQAQTALEPLLEPGPGGEPWLVLGAGRYPIPPRS